MVQEGRDEQEVLDLPFGELRVGRGERVDCLRVDCLRDVSLLFASIAPKTRDEEHQD